MQTFGDGAAQLSGAAAKLLGWRPGDFWKATPAELALALQISTAADGPDLAAIDALRLRFPDE